MPQGARRALLRLSRGIGLTARLERFHRRCRASSRAARASLASRACSWCDRGRGQGEAGSFRANGSCAWQEQRGEYAKAEALYDELLEANPANALVAKRKIAVLKAQKRTQDVIAALNEFLRSFGTDQSAVRDVSGWAS